MLIRCIPYIILIYFRCELLYFYVQNQSRDKKYLETQNDIKAAQKKKKFYELIDKNNR